LLQAFVPLPHKTLSFQITSLTESDPRKTSPKELPLGGICFTPMETRRRPHNSLCAAMGLTWVAGERCD